MYKRYSDPTRVLESMSWDAIPGFIERMAKEEQKEQLYEFWVEQFQYIQLPFEDFLQDSLQSNNKQSNDNISQLNKAERKEELKRREAKSNWNLKEIT